MSDWDLDRARATYNLSHWGAGYFDVSSAGHMEAYPLADPAQGRVDLYELVAQLHQQGLNLPVLVRFTDLLRHRALSLQQAFAAASREYSYGGDYTCVYPIKVNQQRSVVEALYGVPGVGLEAGSKSELIAVLAMNSQRDRIIVCNGYKDREYVRLALIGRALGHHVYLVIEKLAEAALVLEQARDMGIQPLLGIRVCPALEGSGKWQNSGAENAKFGLTAAGLLRVVAELRETGYLPCLCLLHLHLGSQIPDIGDIAKVMREVARYYVELRRLGAPVDAVDVGGGLGVDYDGSRSRGFCSTNYGVTDYAAQVVRALTQVCQAQRLPQPRIITEAGRALSAHHALLITNVVDVGRVSVSDAPPPADSHGSVHQLWEKLRSDDPPLRLYADMQALRHQAYELFSDGVLTLESRAQLEQIYYALCARVRARLDPYQEGQRQVLDELNEKLADRYFTNFSLFQSIPDAWAIDQLFPVVPLHRLNERPTRRGVVEDITCDSDGRINLYVEGAGTAHSLALHPVHWNEPYLLGIFLLGAYQEILGDMHNLFGDTSSVDVVLDGAGGYTLEQTHLGDSSADLLRYVHFDPDELTRRFHQQLGDSGLERRVAKQYLFELEAGIEGYTYLEE